MTIQQAQPVTADDLADWQGYVGRSETRRDMLGIETLRRFAAATGADLDVAREMPPLGHWAFFLDAYHGDRLAEDGHPRRGGFMPPIPLPRRMFAATTIQFAAPLVLGEPGELRSMVAKVRHRAGRTGDLVFVEVERSLVQEGRERVAERQTIVYRQAGGAVAPVQPAAALPRRQGGELWTPGPVELFRFSAATFNAHRIHYDLAYATEREGYPGLVVQGPFSAAKLCALAARGRSPRQVMTGFSFRAEAPLFASQPIHLVPGDEDTDLVEAVRCDGVTAVSARAQFMDKGPV